MNKTRALGWGMLVGLSGAPLLGGCDLVAGIGEFCEVGVDPGCGTGATGGTAPGGGGAGGATTTPAGGGGTGGAQACSGAGTMEPCYTGPDGTQDVGACAPGTRTCQSDGTWGTCEGQSLPGTETCASPEDEDCDGNECAIWSRIFGDGADQFPIDVAVDAQGNVVVLSKFTGKITLDDAEIESAGQYDLFLAKFDASGNYLWSLRVGDRNNQSNCSMVLDSAGNIILAGSFVGALDFKNVPVTTSTGGMDAFVAKLNPNGVAAWVRKLGDAADQVAWDVAVDSNDDPLVIGELAGSMTLQSVISAMDGSVWVGRFNSSDGSSLGQLQLEPVAFSLGLLRIGAGPAGTWVIAGLHNDGVSIGGNVLSGAGTFVAKYDADDGPLWSVHLDVSDPSEMVVDSDGDVIVGASFVGTVGIGNKSLTSNGGTDSLIVKLLSSDGSVLWANSYGGDKNEGGPFLAVGPQKDIFLSLGTTSAKVSFGGGELVGAGLHDLFIASLDPAGAHRWSRVFGDATEQYFARMGADGTGKSIAVAAYTSGSINFGAGELVSNGFDVAVARLAP